MITLHFLDGTPMYLRPDRVESVFETEGITDNTVGAYTLVKMFTGEGWRAKEKPLDVLSQMRDHLGLREPALEEQDQAMWDKIKVGGTD